MNKKSSAKKKPNRKLRRVVRRTFAGILMVSAIAVAAIPAGKTQAGTSVTTNTNNTIDDNRVAPKSYSSVVSDDRTGGTVGGEGSEGAKDSSWQTDGTYFTDVNETASLADLHNGTQKLADLDKAYAT
nr:hypothetical protein [Lachnospiraceae bacterium]